VFDIFCPACERRQLIFPAQIRDLRNEEQGIHISFTCWCGQPARVTTGRKDSMLAVAG
jgi:RNase P subunit RPR2